MIQIYILLCGLISITSSTTNFAPTPTSTSSASNLQEIFSWNVLDWNFPSQSMKQQALKSGAYKPENALPVGIERWRNKLFVSVPRWRDGIPATLNYIPLDGSYDPSPKLNPYPSWEGNELGNCQKGLNTVYRIKADKCNRLWVLDVGTYGYDSNSVNICPYSINVFDLNSDQRIRKYVFRPQDIVSTTFIANIALDMGTNCDDIFAYFSDELGYGLIAYSWEKNRSWRFSHSYFMPDPLFGDYNIAGLNFQWGEEGIFGITASPMGVDGFRTLYFSPLSSSMQFAVSTNILRNESKVIGSYHDFRVIGSRGSNGHTTAKVMDESGIELFSLIDINAIGCWSSSLPYNPQNIGIVDRDDVRLVFPSDIKIDEIRNVWVISERMPVFLESKLDYSDINFRIFTARLDTLVQGTACEPPRTFSQPLNQFQNPNIPQSLIYSRVGQAPINPQYLRVVTSPQTVTSQPPPVTTIAYNPQLRQNIAPKIPSDVYYNQQNVAYVSPRVAGYNTTNVKPWIQTGSYKVQENY